MRIVNETHWTDRSLKKLLVAAFCAEGVSPRNYRVEVVFSRQHDSVTGLGSYSSRWMRIRVPKPWDLSDPGHVKELAQVVVLDLHNHP